MGLFSKKKERGDAAAEPISKEAKPKGGLLKMLSKKARAAAPAAHALAEAEPGLEDSAAQLRSGTLTHADSMARALAQFMARAPAAPGGADGLAPALEALGIGGAGFLQAAEAHPEAVAQILEAAREATAALDQAWANTHNCRVLTELLRGAVACLDLHGQQFSQLEAAKAAELAAHFKAAAGLVTGAGAEGWLLHMAFGAAGPEPFSEAHAGIAEIVQGCVPAHAARRLGSRDYRDVQKPFKRLLKRVGGGSAAAGLKQLAGDERGLAEAAALLGVPAEVLLAEAEASDVGAAVAAGDAGVLYDGVIRDRECAAVFGEYVAPGCKTLDREGFARLLEDMGALALEDPAERQRFLDAQFALADADGDGALSFGECSAYYVAQPLSLPRQRLRAELGVGAERELHARFCQFASFGTTPSLTLDSFRFMKIAKESGLVGADLTPQAVDVVFAQCKPRDARKIDFDGFVSALALVAKQTSSTLEAVVQQVLALEGPQVRGTEPDAVPLHDDRSTYTGVYARGGMSVVDKSIDLSTIVNRDDPAAPASSQPSSRGGSAAPSAPVSRAGSGLPPLALGRSGSCRGTPASSAGNTPTAAGAAAAAARSNSLRLSLHKLQLPAAPAAPVAQVARSASSAGSGAATPRARAAARSSAAATPRGAAAAMPTPRGTAAAMPTPRTRSAASSAAKPAHTPRGMTPRGAPPKKAGQVDSHPVTPSAFAVTPGGGCLTSPAAGACDVYTTDLRRVFDAYASFGSGGAGGEAGLDGARFAKLVRETGLLSRALTPTRVDLTFAKLAGKSRRLDFSQFCCALELLAEARGCSILDVKRAIASSEGPQRRCTTPEAVRLHDDVTSYTGVHARGGPSTADDKISAASLTCRASPRPSRRTSQG